MNGRRLVYVTQAVDFLPEVLQPQSSTLLSSVQASHCNCTGDSPTEDTPRSPQEQSQPIHYLRRSLALPTFMTL